MTVHFVANEASIVDGKPMIVEIQGRSIGVYRIKGELFALHNYCPHAGAPLCKGAVEGTALGSNVYEYTFGRKGEIVRCPWHGWEFDIKSGISLHDPAVRAKSYKVVVEEGKVGIVLR
ncbi:Rieske (2Fe-2S) protein [Paenibacillus sacheonensis]|uniref:Rieske 2Fe-2S domain-containing protein n=1 Tax=Paenibacillus sacheonensis TaxID=742054 RepID=A0A7X4YNU5_9BACL|nr:Rieske (2Fe-2S) protein [Paenibacillus sacheonensis]MBM7565863.1 nitrite reductase/ring-hydroxylating ferredoxin subunit [Paenibacillus sacheonensis]NBC68819.1 Rieske 2Fe-2S domain-containing protein [Paenibacillus sacheonensis]